MHSFFRSSTLLNGSGILPLFFLGKAGHTSMGVVQNVVSILSRSRHLVAHLLTRMQAVAIIHLISPAAKQNESLSTDRQLQCQEAV